MLPELYKERQRCLRGHISDQEMRFLLVFWLCAIESTKSSSTQITQTFAFLVREIFLSSCFTFEFEEP